MKIDQIAKWLIIATPPLIIALSQQQQTLAALAATIFTIAYLIFSFYEIKNLLINKFSKKDNEQSDKSESATEKEATTDYESNISQTLQDDIILTLKTEYNYSPKTEKPQSIKTRLGEKYNIRYLDLSGNETIRDVDAISTDGKYLFAYCHLRMETRSFLLERVYEATDLETGELVYDFEDHMQQKIENDPNRKNNEDLLMIMPIIRLLVYVSRADGRFTAKEKDIVINFIVNVAGIPLEPEEIKKIIERIEAPSFIEFKRIVKDVFNSDAQMLKTIHDHSKMIVETQKTATEDEKRALNFIEYRLNKN